MRQYFWRKVFITAAVGATAVNGVVKIGQIPSLRFEERVRREIVEQLNNPIPPNTLEQPIASDAAFIALKTVGGKRIPIATHGRLANSRFANDYCIKIDDEAIGNRNMGVTFCQSDLAQMEQENAKNQWLAGVARHLHLR